jgi:RsiW-degrading membrane proteinase PrsW (M82 family)
MSDRNIRFIGSIVFLSIEIVLYMIMYIIIRDNFEDSPVSFFIVMILVQSHYLNLKILENRDRIEKLERGCR